jgi:multisubunit Na+/H+ antiporter MnhE subunit
MRYLGIFILSMIFWLLVTFRFTLPNIAAGVVASAITAAIFGRYYFHNVGKFLQPGAGSGSPSTGIVHLGMHKGQL